jgi:hypothetical protein
MAWIQVALDRKQWRDFVKTVTNFTNFTIIRADAEFRTRTLPYSNEDTNRCLKFVAPLILVFVVLKPPGGNCPWPLLDIG